MKKIVTTAALLALMAGTASADGLNLGWNNCPAGAGYTLDNAFACTSNSGIQTLVGSYIPPAGLNAVNGNEMVLDLQTDQAALTAWWNMGTGAGCVGRTGTPTGDFGFLGGPFGCEDYWAGAASGGLDYTPGFAGPNRARIRLVAAVAEAVATSEDPGLQYYSFKIFISNARSAGLTACPGCLNHACIVFNSLKITQNPSETLNPTVVVPATANFVTWRGGLVPDCQVTPTHSTTWGSIKALYR